MSLCLSVMLIPLSLVAEDEAVEAWDLVPINLGNSDSGLVFLPVPELLPLLASHLLFMEYGGSFLMAVIEFPSKLGNTSLDLYLADQALLLPACILLGRI